MKVVRIVQTGESTYKPVCQFTEEDKLPVAYWDLLDREFILENMISAKGFWFYVSPVLEQPPLEKED